MDEKNQFSVTEYLKRIDCQLEVNPSITFLRKLHRQHLYHIPFENLDNFLGQQIILDIKRIYQKVILNQRGGFCYELNGLFYTLLKALHFDVQFVSARVFDKDDNLSREFDHMALLVRFESETYLADVGFGISFKSPLKLSAGLTQMDFNQYYKIEKDIDDIYTVKSSFDGQNFKNEYSFSAKNRTLIEFIDMCEFHNRSKDSHLTKRRFITQANKSGQITLTDTLLTIQHLGGYDEITIHNLDEFKVKLQEHYGIKYGAMP